MVASLTERFDLADTLARWHHTEWAGFYPGWTIESCRAELMAHTDPNCLPTTLVAFNDAGELLGSVSLLLDDLPGYECFSPWLASLFVRADHRCRGVGRLLLEAAVGEARRLGVPELYLFTADHEGYYAARGWAVAERGSAGGQPVTIMTRHTEGRRAFGGRGTEGATPARR
jgi:GNAT superfamily N-acetyltransferase